MRALIGDLSGKKFWKLLVLRYDHMGRNGVSYWLCRCDCGNEYEVQRPALVWGESKQCRICALKPKYIGGIYGKYYHSIEDRAIKHNFDFNLTPEYLAELLEKQNHMCALSGLILDFHSNPKSYSGTASLDRIDSSKGYTIGNVQWVHRAINFMKGSLSENDFIFLCSKVTEQAKEETPNRSNNNFSWIPSWDFPLEKEKLND